MREKLKISRKSYETIFSFRIEGLMGDVDVPTPPPKQPPFPPLTPLPPGPTYPGGGGGGDNPLGTLPPIGPYYGDKQWRQLVYRFSREYGWNQWILNQEWTWGEDAIQRFNDFKATGGWWGQDPSDPNYGNSAGVPIPCNYSFSVPDDRGVEEVVLGMYPIDEPIPSAVNKWVMIASFDHYYTCGEHIDTSETGLPPGNYDPTFVSRIDNFQLYFTGDTVIA